MHQLLLTAALSVLPAQGPAQAPGNTYAPKNPYTPTPTPTVPATRPAPSSFDIPMGNTSNRWTPNLPQYGQTGIPFYLPSVDPTSPRVILGHRFGNYAVIPEAARAFPPSAGGDATPSAGDAPGGSGALQTPGAGGLNTLPGPGASTILPGTGREIVPQLADRDRPGLQVRPFQRPNGTPLLPDPQKVVPPQ